MPLTQATRPALQMTSSPTRALSILTPARLATETRPQSRNGFLAEKGPFPFQQRAISYDEVVARSKQSAAVEELLELRSENADQKRKIEVLRGTISQLVAGEKNASV